MAAVTVPMGRTDPAGPSAWSLTAPGGQEGTGKENGTWTDGQAGPSMPSSEWKLVITEPTRQQVKGGPK